MEEVQDQPVLTICEDDNETYLKSDQAMEDASNDVSKQIESYSGSTTATVTQTQFVIVSNVNDSLTSCSKIPGTNSNTVESTTMSEGTPTSQKFLKIEGENGQTFMLAVTENVSDLRMISPQIKLIRGLQEGETKTKNFVAPSAGVTKKQVKNTKSDDISQAWFTTRDDKNTLQNSGKTWKQGQWTKDEVDLLKRNIDKYCADHNISDATEIIFQMSKDERKNFYRTVAKGLDRPLFAVYRRVTRMYDQKNHVGKYSVEEIAKLRDLRVTHGNDWTTIGAVLGRSASSVKDKCRLMKDKCNTGKWLVEEERRLTAAVYELAKVKPGEMVTHGLSWASVADKVGSRSEKQCRTKWLNYLNWKEVGGTDWTRQDDIHLINKLCDLSVDSESLIDWTDLAQGWPSARSPQWLRGKWWSIKRHVPNYQSLSFTDVLNYLKVAFSSSRHEKMKNIKDGNLTLAFTRPVGLTTNNENAAVEVLQEWPSDSTLVITQPRTVGDGISFDGTSLSTDHITYHVQTLPLHFDKSVEEGVDGQIIVQADEETGDQSSAYSTLSSQSVSLPAGIKVEQDLNSLSQNRDLDEMSSSNLDNCIVKYEVLTTVTDSGLPSEGVQTDIGVVPSEQAEIVHSESESSNLDW